MSAFAHRGVIEGFYGTPYTHADRLWLIDRLGAWGMNRYVYAPKDDPLHRAEWRTPYPPAAQREFAELVERGESAGVSVGFAVSPGLSMEYGAAADVRALQEKFRDFHRLGARFFSLALDDVPTTLLHHGDQMHFGSLAAAHVGVAHAVAEAIGDESTLWLVPTDYVGVEATPYLEILGRDLAPSIEVGWTGRTVISPSITAEEAACRAATLRRRVLIWDNVPVADGPMRPMLHLGPFAGRGADLAAHASGVLLNPMLQAHASAVCIRTAADYLTDPQHYDPERSWCAALAEIGDGAPEAFAVFAAAHRFSPLFPTDRDADLENAVEELRAALGAADDATAALARLSSLLEMRLGAAAALRDTLTDRHLADEIEPWLAVHAAESARMHAASELLEVMCGEAAPMQQVFAVFRFEGTLTRIAPGAVTSYGPRRVLYPQLTALRDDVARFGADPALFVRRCLADELIELAEAVALTRLRGPAAG
jgi:hyaluronoglucosaminidase